MNDSFGLKEFISSTVLFSLIAVAYIYRVDWLIISTIMILMLSVAVAWYYKRKQHPEDVTVPEVDISRDKDFGNMINQLWLRNKPLMLIGIAGKARAGKDAVRCALMECIQTDPALYKYKCVKESIIRPLRDITTMFYGVSAAEGSSSDRETVGEEWPLSPRKFMQLMGTEVMKTMMGAHVWLKMLIRRILSDNIHIAVVADIRAENEAVLFSTFGIVIRVERPCHTTAVEAHATEQPIDDRYVDCTIINDGSLHDLHVQVSELYKTVLREQIVFSLDIQPNFHNFENAKHDYATIGPRHPRRKVGQIKIPINGMN